MPAWNLDLPTLLLVIMLVSVLIAVAAKRNAPAPLTVRTTIPFTVLSLTQAFDPEHAILWQTQVPVLNFIGAMGGLGRRTAELERLYSSLARRYPELYEGTSFSAWLAFLMESGLIAVCAGTVTITPDGGLFLHCFSCQESAIRSSFSHRT